MKDRRIVAFFTVVLLSLAGLVNANTNFTWHFKDTGYEVSDPTLIEVDTNGTGNAQLILQAETHYRSTFDEYTNFSVKTDVGIGWDARFLVSKSGSLYNSYGVFESRIIDGGGGNTWRSWDARIGDDANKLISDPSIVAYYAMDNDGWVNAATGLSGTPVGGLEFTTDSIIGSHAGRFIYPRYLVTHNPTLLNGATECTIALWVKLNSFVLDHAYIMSRGSKTMGIVFRALALQAFSCFLNGDLVPAPNNSISLDEWMFISFTWKASNNTLIVYKNGVEVARGPVSGASVSQTTEFRIGSDSAIGTRITDGVIDEVVIWNRAISSNEVAELYNLRYAQYSPVRVQVRSGNSPANVLTKDYVGRDGTTNSFLIGKGLPTSQDFNPTERYAQYRAHITVAQNRLKSPYVDMVGLIGDNGMRFDDLYADFLLGNTNDHIALEPKESPNGYLALRRLDNGGFSTNGTYTSEAIDGGAPMAWSRIYWDSAKSISNNTPGLIGFWPMNGTWAREVGDNDGVGYGGATWDMLSPKLGAGSGLFNDQSSYVRIPFNTNIYTMSFWLYNENADDGILEMHSKASNSYVAVSIANHVVELAASTNVTLSYSLYLNGSPHSARLLPDWNHVVLCFNNPIFATNINVGVALGDYMGGKMDDLAIFNRVLSRTEISSQYYQGRRESAGTAKAQVRYGNTLPLTNDFAGPGQDPYSYFADGSPLTVPNAQYLQYRLYFGSDGNGTPAIDAVRIQNDSGYTIHDTRDEFNKGSYDDDLTAWYDEEIKLQYLAGPGPANLALASDGTARGNWHLDEASFASGVEDATFQTGVGTVNGALPSALSVAGAGCASFSGNTNYITLPTVNLPGDFSFNVWFSTTSTNRGALASSDDGSGYFTLEVNGDGTGATSTGQVAFVVNGNGTYRVASSRKSLNDGKWHNFVAVRNGSQIHVYIDGVRDATANAAGFSSVGNGSVYIGREGGVKTAFYSGLIDEIAVWNRALTEAEIGNNCAAGFATLKTGEVVSDAIDAGMPAIWQTISWVTDGIYGRRLDPASDDSLVALWSMENVAAGRITNSVTGVSSLLTGSPSSNANGRIGACLDFASGDYVTVSDATLDANEMSVEAWVNMDVVAGRTVFDKSNGANNGFALRTDANGTPLFKVDSYTAAGYLPVRLEKWTHLCGTFDGAVVRLYVDGELAGQVDAVGATPGDGGTAYIGGRAAGLYDGRMDEVAVHDRALLPEEVLDHYKAGAVTLKFQCRTATTKAGLNSATFYGPGKDPNTFYTDARNDDMLGSLNLGQFFQFKAILATEDYKFSPSLSGVKVFVANYPSTDPWVSPTYANAYLFHGELIGASHTASNNAGTSVGYQISQDNSRWWYWDGTEWASATLATHTNPIGVISANLGSFYDQVCPKTGGLFRFKAFLHSEGDLQMWLDEFTLTASEGRIVVTSPNGVETGAYAWVSSVPYPITWSSIGKVSDALVVDLYDETGLTNITTLATGVANTGVTNLVISGTPGRYRIRVWDSLDPTIGDYSDSYFELAEEFRLTAPDGGEFWRIGQTYQATWSVPASGVSPVVDLWFCYDGDNYMSNQAAWVQVATGITNILGDHNIYSWLIPSNDWRLVSEKARMAVVPNGLINPLIGTSKRDFSNANFTNAGIVVTYPALDQGIRSGNIEPVTYAAAGVSTSVVLELWTGTNWAMLGTNVCAPISNNVLNVVLEGRTTNAQIRATSGGIVGVSELFTLADVNIAAPLGGSEVVRSHWQIGTTNQIQWTSSGAKTAVNIKYTTEELGGVWMTITNNMPNVDDGITTNTFNWVIPGPPSGTVTVRVESAFQTTLYAAAGPFSMSGVEITKPVGSVTWDFIDTNEVTWLSRDGASIVGIDMSFDNGVNFELITNNYTEAGPYGTWLNFGQIRRPTDQARIRLRLEHQTDPATVFTDISSVSFGLRGIAFRFPSNNVVVNLATLEAAGLQWYSALTLESQVQMYYLPDGPASTVSNIIWRSDGMSTYFPNTDSGSCSNGAPWQIDRGFRPSTNAVLKVLAGSVHNAVSEPFKMRGVRITYPWKDDLVKIGDTITVQWDYAVVADASRANFSISLNGTNGPFTGTGFVGDSQIDFGGKSWTVDPDSDPTTNAIIKMEISSPPQEVDNIIISQPFTLQGIKFLDPIAGTNWMLGTSQDVRFMIAGLGSGVNADVYYSPDGVTYDAVPVTNNMPITDGVNAFTWTIENRPDLTRMPSTNAHLKIVSGVFTNVSRAFTVSGIKIVTPRLGDVWAVSDLTNHIGWVEVGMGGVNDLSYTVDVGTNIMLIYPHTAAIVAGVSGTNYAWTMVDDSVGKPVRIGLTNGTFVTYSEDFEIVERPSIRIKSPVAGAFWKVTETNVIEWIRGGDMSNSFRIVVTYHGGHSEQLGVDGAFSIDSGVFSYEWKPIPDHLGPAKLVITNLVNPDVWDVFTNFTIAPKFEVDPFTEQPYALKPLTFFFTTRGSVASGVDFYYSTDPLRAPSSWKLINPGDPFTVANNANLPYNWTLPDARTPQAWLRIQDHSYTQRFSAASPGPYNDYGTFEIKYYSVVWMIKDNVSSQHLDHVTVMESTGKTYVDVNSPWTNYYPYGEWDSVLYRENFFDFPLLKWKPQNSPTNEIYMTRSAMEPDYHVLSDFAYDASNRIFRVHSWLERSGAIMPQPASCRLSIYNDSGVALETFFSTAPDPNGVFWQSWDVKATEQRLGVSFTANDLFFAKVEITFAGFTYSAGMTFALRLAAESEQVAAIQAIVDNATSNILHGVVGVSNIVEGVATNLMEFRTSATASLSNIQANVIAARTDITNMVASIDAVTNIVPYLESLTDSVAIIEPALTNLMTVITNMEPDTVGTLARILTRPTSVSFGSTNTILYKTRPGYGGAVTITVSSASQGQVHIGNMTEFVAGLYHYDLYCNWGTNSYVVTCTDPYPAHDSMVLQVVGKVESEVPGMLESISNQIASVETQVSNVYVVVGTLGVITNMVESISNSIAQLEFVLTNGALNDLAGLSNTLAGIDWNDIRMIGTNVLAISNAIATVNWGQLTELTNLVVLTNTLGNMDWNDINSLKANVGVIQTAVDAVKAQVEGMGDVDLSAVESGLAAIRSSSIFELDIGSIARIESQIGSVDDVPGASTFFGQINALEKQVSDAEGAASGASKKAQSAKTEASNAAGGVQGLKAALSKGDLEGAKDKLDEVKATLNAARDKINELHEVRRVGQLYEAIRNMSQTIEELASREGYGEFLREQPGTGSGSGDGVGEGEDMGETMRDLNKTIGDMKLNMEFMGKLLDEMRYEPVVQADLVGE